MKIRHRQLLKDLDLWIGQTTKTPSHENKCCIDPKIRTDGIMDTCVNCGNTTEYSETILKKQFLNPRYQLSTSIGCHNGKYKGVARLHRWLTCDYRENMANNNYREMRQIAEKLSLNEWIINHSCMIYKKIYIDDNISSRNKIKRSLFIYCLYKGASHYEKEFDVIQVLKDNKLSIGNYNKCLLKVDDEDKLFLNSNMCMYYKKLGDNFETDITLIDIIKEYNRICNIGKDKKCRLNNNSILVASIHLLLNLDDDTEDEKKFYKIFSISKTTIQKFYNLVETV